jgi:RecB family exonuclease
LTDERVLAHIAGRDAWAAGRIERWHNCPAAWFVDWLLRPDEIEPESMYLVRGGLQHRVLQRVFESLGAPLRATNIDAACALARRALEDEATRARMVVAEQFNAALLRRIEADLVAYLRAAAAAESDAIPTQFELAFGTPDGAPAVEIAPGVRLSGRIDRVDRLAQGAEAIIVDYKGARGGAAQASWLRDGVLQIGLYALALPHLVEGMRVAGALYQPIGSRKDLRPRGAIEQGADAGRKDIVRTDWVEPEAFAELLEGVREAAVTAVAEMREGRVVSRPTTCSTDGCRNRAICRCEP